MIRLLLFSLFAVGLMLSPEHSYAQEDLSSAKGVESIGTSLIPDCIRNADEVVDTDAYCVLDSITFYTNILLLVVAIGAFLYLLYGAFLYATAFGEDTKIGLAKKIVTHAIIGILVAGLSALLVELLRSLLKA